MNNHKIAKGNLETISDSSITIIQSAKKVATEVNYAKIGSIKLKRSFGHTVAITTLVTATSFGILGAATASNEGFCIICTPAEGLAAGGIFGAAIGAVASSIVGGLRNDVTKIGLINGDFGKWKTARQQLSVAMAK